MIVELTRNNRQFPRKMNLYMILHRLKEDNFYGYIVHFVLHQNLSLRNHVSLRPFLLRLDELGHLFQAHAQEKLVMAS